jgi:chromate transporter
VVAGGLFVLPSIFILWGLSYTYVVYGKVPWIAAIFYGLKPAVLAIVAAAVIRIGKRALKNEVMWTIAALAFIAIFFLKAPFPIIIGSAALIGLIGGRLWKQRFLVFSGHGEKSGHEQTVISDSDASPEHTRPSLARAVRVCLIWLTLWWGPVLLAAFCLGPNHTVAQEGIFFSKAAMVTFGGAYAVLPYVAQQAVEHYHWLQAPQMLDGLGLAETTPGPLIMVVQFVGFLGGWNQPGQLSPLSAATLGALITTWTTFTPCFLWVFLGGPHIEQLRGNEKLTAALSTVTAAVVGVIMNLAVWFGLHVLFPSPGKPDFFAVVVALAAFLGMLRWKWGIIPVVLGAGALGLVYKTVF